jgi:hypothetical protein
LLRWCERNEVRYVIGLVKNPRLARLALRRSRTSRQCFSVAARSSVASREFGDVARTWGDSWPVWNWQARQSSIA